MLILLADEYRSGQIDIVDVSSTLCCTKLFYLVTPTRPKPVETVIIKDKILLLIISND